MKLIYRSIVRVLLFVLPITIIAQNKKAASPELNSGSFSNLAFRSIGPAVTSGRVSDFAVNPKNHSEYYVATSAGGVWKTTNHGVTHQPIFDAQGSYSIGCVTIDPNNSNIIWVGSGENNNQRAVSYGDGVYKSEDGGKTWKNMGAQKFRAYSPGYCRSNEFKYYLCSSIWSGME